MNRLSIRSRLRIVCAQAARCIALCFVSADPDLARGASVRRFQVVPNPTALEDTLQPSCVLFMRDLCDYRSELYCASLDPSSQCYAASQAVPDALRERTEIRRKGR